MTKNIKDDIINDLAVLQDYLSKNEPDSYILLVNGKDRNKYYVAYNMNGNPNDLIAQTELTMLELKLKVAAAYEQGAPRLIPDKRRALN